MATVKKMKEIVPEYKSNNSVYEVLDKENQDESIIEGTLAVLFIRLCATETAKGLL